MSTSAPTPPAGGERIAIKQGRLHVPSRPVIPFIEGDGTGPDIWRASQRVFDAAVAKAYGGSRSIAWMEVYAGEKAFKQFNNWLPDETVRAFQEYLVGIKGPLTTPVGGGIRSLNVALRQMLDLYVCLRPVQYFQGVPSPVKRPEAVNMVIFRENTEDIYAGIEWAQGSPEAKKVLDFLAKEFPKQFKKVRFPETTGIGVKPVSEEGTHRLVRAGHRDERTLERVEHREQLLHEPGQRRVTREGDVALGPLAEVLEVRLDALGRGPHLVALGRGRQRGAAHEIGMRLVDHALAELRRDERDAGLFDQLQQRNQPLRRDRRRCDLSPGKIQLPRQLTHYPVTDGLGLIE